MTMRERIINGKLFADKCEGNAKRNALLDAVGELYPLTFQSIP